jgi:hypothetical protein
MTFGWSAKTKVVSLVKLIEQAKKMKKEQA